ncbi:hypothetical protein [Belnapia moabensis]|uniref:hypothetical protein n=1 Tax=Belnapia moabensis TaxID=365533 RepID=UPI0005BC6E22|nr:hypothetical protein [Belnapia moabensis]
MSGPGWLDQERPGDGSVLLRDWPAGGVVRLGCRRCGRAGQYRLATLIERFGPAAGLPAVRLALSANCPKHDVGYASDPCGAYYPDLAPKG